MIQAILWKEWREQRVIALAVLGVGALALVLTAQFAAHMSGHNIGDNAGARELMAPALAYLAGIVCGAILLADEKEVGTFEFLISLPCSRRSLWLGKVAFGVLLTGVQATIIAALAIALDCLPPAVTLVEYWMWMLLVGLLSFGWGIFGGAIARSTLGAVFQGAIASFAVGLLLALPSGLLIGWRTHGLRFVLISLAFAGAWIGIGLYASARLFTTVDRRRALAVNPGISASTARSRSTRRSWFGIVALVWLSVRQAVYVISGAAAVGIALGAVMLLPESRPFLIWPGVTLALGVLAGVTTFSEEQARGIARFWAERRLPLGRFWLVKVICHFLIAAIAALVMLIPIYAASPGALFRTRLFSDPEMGIRAELFRFIWLGLVYGFVAGHLAGMIFRKTIVAGLVAAVTAASLVALIGPSVIGGGASAWQVWGPAVVLLATARWLLYPWATERATQAGPIFRSLGGCALAVLVLAAGIAWRILEIPDATDRLAESGFEASIPPQDAKEAGNIARSVVLQYSHAREQTLAFFPTPTPARAAGPVPTNAPTRPGALPMDDIDFLERAVRSGAPADVDLLGKWLDRVFADNWPLLLDKIEPLPPGPFEDPRDLDYFTPDDKPRDLREMTLVLRARGMQKQAEGDPAAYAHFLPGALAVCRSARFKTGSRTPLFALQAEEILLEGITDWLAKLEGRRDLVKSLLATLIRHEREMPIGGDDVFWADRVVLRNTLQRVGAWLPTLLDPRAANRGSPSAKADAEAEVIAVAWNVPWERARRERIFRVFSHAELRVPPEWLSGLHLRGRWRTDQGNRLANPDRRGLTLRRATQLQLALRLFQLEHGKPARNLAQLVPDYLPSSPEDPYSRLPDDPNPGRPFNYRLSAGEIIAIDSVSRPSAAEVATSAVIDVARAMANPDGGPLALLALTRLRDTRSIAMPPGNILTVRFGPGPTDAQTITVAPGSGVLWSTGPDRNDDGGHLTPRRGAVPVAKQDWVFVVPPPLPAKK